MESRKRVLSSSNSIASDTKRQKEEVKELFDDANSNDSFENFCVVRKSLEISPKSRSHRISLVNEEDDSFEEISKDEKPKKESGVNNFPCLYDDSIVVYLKVKSVNNREGNLDLECVDKDGNTRMVYLQDRWADLEIEEGNSINLIAAQIWDQFDFIVNDDQGIVILNPDTLVPCTAIASATWCSRKTVLNDKFKFGNASNKAMLLGTIIHEIFQAAITNKKRPVLEEDLLGIWKKQAPKFAEELVALSFTPGCLDSELQPYFAVVCKWINKHYPNSNSFFAKRELLPSKSELLEVHDIEENIWDSKLGLKGKVDVTMRTKKIKGIESLELKTGKSSFSSEHSGQVLLYCMMHSSRHEQPIGLGNILYLKDGESRCVTPKAAELLGIIQQRNNLSGYFEDPTSSRLPAPRSDSKFCDKCDHKVMCCFQQTSEEKYTKSSETMMNFAKKEMEHLKAEHIEYVSNWIRWISAEWKCERERVETHTKDLWLKNITDRVTSGTCLANLEPISEENSNSQRVLISFTSTDSVVGTTFRAGDVCLLSNTKHNAIAFAIVDLVTEKMVRVSCDKSVRKRYDGPFHLDKYTSMSTHSTTLGNLVCFMQNDEIGERLRNVLVDLSPPATIELNDLDVPVAVKKIIVRAKLNNEQRMAVIQALVTQDFTIVEGLPGSGKTTLIAVLIQCLVVINKKVLLAAFTHSAVDNILGKLRKEVSAEKILRLGSSSTIREDIQKLTLKAKLENESSEDYYSAVKRVMKTTPIVACTCHHVPRELLFSYRQFDVVIVDEASMVLEPLILPVLSTSQKFVLVGDVNQLMPLVISKKAKTEGAGVSTMEKLQRAHPKSVVSLTSQYRMNKQLSELSSKLFYANRLICGNEAIARSSLDRTGDYRNEREIDDYMKNALSGDIADSCIFLDTQEMMKCEDGSTGGTINDGEARLVVELCEQFMKNGIKAHEIGVMSAYRKQVDHIRNILKNDDLEVNTIDSYQGREKRVIIWSLTWTHNSSKKSELLREDRRVNVALTRAKQKLVIVGCKKSAETIPVLFRLSQTLTNHCNIAH